MSEYRRLCPADEIAPETARLFVLDGKEIALFRVGDVFHAMENTCLHAGGPLHEGSLEGHTVTCPWHDWKFDVRTGECDLNPKVRLDRYPVRIVDGHLEIRY